MHACYQLSWNPRYIAVLGLGRSLVAKSCFKILGGLVGHTNHEMTRNQFLLHVVFLRTELAKVLISLIDWPELALLQLSSVNSVNKGTNRNYPPNKLKQKIYGLG